ncbi:zinc-ribbon domain-containing protein [Paracoccus lutimaris]|nr:zinc-ribbon domain-containing protein [Paracoccus lutimaris]
MRLTCPRCGAQYEIAAAAIPAAGREVECSACSHVWFQPGQAKAAQSDSTPYDPQARPALNRPLNESILAILREETARELQARQGDTGTPVPEADQNIANAAAEAHAATAHAEAVEFAAPDAQAEAYAETPPPAMPDGDWPATTVTVPPTGDAPEPMAQPPLAPEPEPAAPMTETVVEAASEIVEQASDPEPAPFEAPEPPRPEPEPEDMRPEPVVAALPDAAELAATLTRSSPVPTSAAPIAPEPAPASADTRQAEAEAVAAAALPVAAAAKRGSGYASGFGLAAMLALGIVAVYALAPRVAADEDGGLLAEWRQEIDRGRLWLHDRIIGE